MMNRILPTLWTIGFCLAGAGCGGAVAEERDAVPIYEAVLEKELPPQKQEATFFLSVDHQDPAPELLKRLRKRWPTLEAASKAPKGRRLGVSVSELQWIDSHTAELRYSFSNGMDGRVSRYRVVREDGKWMVERETTEAIS